MSKMFGTVRALLKVPEEMGLTDEQIQLLIETGAYADICEAAREGKLSHSARDQRRSFLGLPALNPPAVKTVCEFDVLATEEFDLYAFFISTDNPMVKFGWVDADLKRYFKTRLIPIEGLRRLVVSELIRDVIEKELLAVGQKTTWSDVKYLVEQQPNGEEGKLLVNGRANIFFIGDRRVYVYWYDDGWRVGVNPVREAGVWGGGSQLLSRN